MGDLIIASSESMSIIDTRGERRVDEGADGEPMPLTAHYIVSGF